MHEFSVEEGPAAPPALPVLKNLDYSVIGEVGLAAVFSFEPFEGTLAVDRDGRTEDPIEALDVSLYSWPGAVAEPREFRLARELCQVNFPALDFGVSTTLRFGVLDAAGQFSGWTEPLFVTFPSREEVEARQALQVATGPRSPLPPQQSNPSGACSLAVPGAPLAWSRGLLASMSLCVAGAWRRRHGARRR